MKDKEQQIGEIKQIIDDRCEAELGQVHASSMGGKVTKTVSTKLIAKDIYEYLTKDSVVLSREEYERLKRVENEKDKLYEIKRDLENQLIEKGWTDYEGADEIEKRVRKETVEEIITKIKQLLNSVETIRDDDTNKLQPDIGYSMREVDNLLDELAEIMIGQR